MKRILSLLLLLVLLAACQRPTVLPEATSAAYDIYRMYADREELTVALAGDYCFDSSATFNAVMLQAHDSLVWQQLLEEFGLAPKDSVGKTVRRSLSVFEEEYRLNCACEQARQFINRKIDDLRSREASHLPPVLDTSLHEGEIGYVKFMDKNRMTLCLFVFSDFDQLHAIIDHVFDKIVPTTCCNSPQCR